MPRYYIAGIIQIEVTAANATDAVEKAFARQDTLMKSPSLNICVDNICPADFAIASVDLGDAWMIDDEIAARGLGK